MSRSELNPRDVRPEKVPPGRATRTVIVVFGVLAALAGAEHGVGEILQGSIQAVAPLIQSWPDHAAFATLNGEPAFTVIPNLLVAGIVTIVVSVVLAVWAIFGAHRRHGAWVLAGLSSMLFVVGGGFGPPLVGFILACGAVRLRVPERRPEAATSRFPAGLWPWAAAIGVLGYLSLVPGTLIAYAVSVDLPEPVVYGFMILAFGGLIVALVGARAHDRGGLGRVA